MAMDGKREVRAAAVSWRQRWRTLPQNPIYLREKGAYGNPNPFYDHLRRYSPFVVLGALVLAICAGYANPALFVGDDRYILLWCLICLPNVALTCLTWIGVIMAPALTAPTINLELSRGTWDILRLTPQPVSTIIVAKMMGALSRLPIWRVMAVLSILQAAVLLCGMALIQGGPQGLFLALSIVLRPWVEILFAAVLGMICSSWLRSATLALVAAYGGVLLLKVLTGFFGWLILGLLLETDIRSLSSAVALGPVTLYVALAAVLFSILIRRADKIAYN